MRRVRTYGTEFTTRAPITRVHYTIRTYDATGRLVQTVQGRRLFDFGHKGIAWLRRNTLDPRSRPGKVRITVTVGRAGVAGCRVTFRQPPLAAALPVVPGVVPPAPAAAGLQIAAVGDIHPPSASSNSAATAAAAASADFILGLGDYQYQSGTLSDYNAYFDKD